MHFPQFKNRVRALFLVSFFPRLFVHYGRVRVSQHLYTSMSSVELHSHTQMLLNIFFYKFVYRFFWLYFQIGEFQWFCFIICVPFYFLKPQLEGSLSISDLAWKGCLSPAAQGEQCKRWKRVGRLWFVFSRSPVSIPCPCKGCSGFRCTAVSWAGGVSYK